MTYLVQKTNMFKQKMKIDDNIICNKMLTVQLWCICPQIALLSIVLTEFVMYYPRQRGNNFRWKACLSGDCVFVMCIPLDISTVTACAGLATGRWQLGKRDIWLFFNINMIFVGLSGAWRHNNLPRQALWTDSLKFQSHQRISEAWQARILSERGLWCKPSRRSPRNHSQITVCGLGRGYPGTWVCGGVCWWNSGRGASVCGRVGMHVQHGVADRAVFNYPQRTCIVLDKESHLYLHSAYRVFQTVMIWKITELMVETSLNMRLYCHYSAQINSVLIQKSCL